LAFYIAEEAVSAEEPPDLSFRRNVYTPLAGIPSSALNHPPLIIDEIFKRDCSARYLISPVSPSWILLNCFPRKLSTLISNLPEFFAPQEHSFILNVLRNVMQHLSVNFHC
jgi:hypothetical protein